MDYMIYGLYKPPAGMQWNSCKSVLVFPPLCSQSPAASTILDSILVAKFYPPKGLKDCKGIKQSYTSFDAPAYLTQAREWPFTWSN